jgi:hypothetical protein
MSALTQWGYLNKAKWALIEVAPLTASGLNEILFTAQYRSQIVEMSSRFGLRTGPRSSYTIVRLDKLPKKEESNG